MSFLGLFNKKRAESVALVEVGPDSVAGGLVYFKEFELPLVVYTKRLPLESQTELPKILTMLGDFLVREGAPRLIRVAGSGTVDSVLACVKAPWQETIIRSEKIERTTPFTITRSLIKTVLEKSAEAPPGRILADEFVVGTILDGYPVHDPIGKKASYSNIIVLASFIDETLSRAIADTLRKLFHTTTIRLIAAAALRFEAMRAVFPHEEDYLTVDVAGNSVVTTLIRRGLLSAVEHASSIPEGYTGALWLGALTKTLEAITERYPLPRKVLLVAGENERADVREKIEVAPLAKLRLSNDPPVVVAIEPSHLMEHLKVAPEVDPDLGIGLMTVFWTRAKR